MKKWIYCVSFMAAVVGVPVFSDPVTSAPAATPTSPCSQLTAAEQGFSSQLTNPAGKSMFCSQFTPAQRQQAMQMMGKPDAAGKQMTADSCVQQVMMSLPAAPKTRGAGGCPVK